MAKKHRAMQNSAYIKPNDGRKHNGKNKGDTNDKTQSLAKTKITSPAQLNKPKKERIAVYALNAMKKVFGSEEAAWESLAEQAQDSFAHMNLLWQYRYGKPNDGADDAGKVNSKAPIIHFHQASPTPHPKEEVKKKPNTDDIEDAEVVE
jgi:hypothetical protein